MMFALYIQEISTHPETKSRSNITKLWQYSETTRGAELPSCCKCIRARRADQFFPNFKFSDRNGTTLTTALFKKQDGRRRRVGRVGVW